MCLKKVCRGICICTYFYTKSICRIEGSVFSFDNYKTKVLQPFENMGHVPKIYELIISIHKRLIRDHLLDPCYFISKSRGAFIM